MFFQLGNRKAYEAFQEGGEDGLKEYIYSKMWNPEYRYFPTNVISTNAVSTKVLLFFFFQAIGVPASRQRRIIIWLYNLIII